MKSIDQVNAFFRAAGIRTDPAGDKMILADACRAGGLAYKKRAVPTGQRIWRFVMNNRISAIAAAVVFVIGVGVGLHFFTGTTVKAVGFADVRQAIQQVPWMHATVTGFEQPIGDSTEHWAGFAKRIQATVSSKGDATFMNEGDQKRWDYDPKSNTVTIRYLEAFPLDVAAPELMPALISQAWEQEGAQVIVKTGAYRGRDVQIQQITSTNAPEDGQSLKLILFIDPDSSLLYGVEVNVLDADGRVIGSGTSVYDYPLSGPASIYDLGVPSEALVVDATPSTDFNAIWEAYKQHKAEVTDEYLAVIVLTDAPGSDQVREVNLDFKSGQRERLERHFVSSDEAIPGLKMVNGEPSIVDLESLLAWSRSRYDDLNEIIMVNLYDGQYDYSVRRDQEKGWSRVDKVLTSGGESGFSQTVAYRGWPTIASTGRIIEDDYARENGLICIEELTQGRKLGHLGVSHPGRFLSYLDPAHDSLCCQQVMEWRPNAEWQQDKDYLKGVDSSRIGSGTIIVQEIIEMLQAPNGHWYPKVIVTRQTESPDGYAQERLTVTGVTTIYVDVSPTFPDGLFDGSRLP